MTTPHPCIRCSRPLTSQAVDCSLCDALARTEEPSMNDTALHAAIMNLPCTQSKDLLYKFGHRDARHAAADLALEWFDRAALERPAEQPVGSALANAAEQFLAAHKDGNVCMLLDYFADIFGEALATTQAPQSTPGE